MKSFRTALTVILVALWPLVTSHCQLEQIPGLDFLHCSESESATPHQDNDCDTDGCAVVESSFYKTEDRTPVPAAPLLLMALLLPALEPASQPSHRLADFSTIAPPELPVTWQFASRAALPPRAPSLAS